jgi:multimeric flavodoxin WrbA
MKVKIIGVSGSPRKGNTNILVKECLKSAETLKDVETEFIHLADYKIEGGCKACLRCFAEPNSEKFCWAYDDEMKLVLKKLMEGDGFIFGSPVYWGSWTAQFKTFVDRSHPFVGFGKLLRNKPAGAVTVALGSIAGQEHVIAELLRFIHMHDMIPIGIGVIWPMEGMASPWGVTGRQGFPDNIPSVAPGNRDAVKQDKAAMACARVLGIRVAEMAKVVKAGFTIVNPENNETKWPAGPLTAEFQAEDHHTVAYVKKEKH